MQTPWNYGGQNVSSSVGAKRVLYFDKDNMMEGDIYIVTSDGSASTTQLYLCSAPGTLMTVIDGKPIKLAGTKVNALLDKAFGEVAFCVLRPAQIMGLNITFETPKPTSLKGVFDMTDDYTLVIVERVETQALRVGLRCDAGKIQIGTYNAAGTARTGFYELDWASLGLPGEPWQYLGATIELDITGDVPMLKNTPEIYTFFIPVGELKFANDTTVQLADTKTISIAHIQSGYFAKNHLINEGGKYIPMWKDDSTNNSSSTFWTTPTSGWFAFTEAPLYNQSVVVVANEAPSSVK